VESQGRRIDRDGLNEDSSIKIWSEASESEGQLLEDIEKDGPMVTSVCFPHTGCLSQ
jgi:hypothetical protein